MGRVRLLEVFSLACLLCACHTSRQVTQTDSLRVEIRERDRVVYDTVDVYIEPALVERLIPDTFSLIETAFARSEAEVRDGNLRHTLETKGKARGIAPVRVITRDSIVYRDRYIESLPVPTKTHWWQRAWRLLPLVLLLVIYWLTRRIKHYRDRCI
ncbi:MAG: hypothetical protein LUC33_03595 [Prevotellaceae bacterium]|nr:hypothetical protein [Prevotellaceae bacterium]